MFRKATVTLALFMAVLMCAASVLAAEPGPPTVTGFEQLTAAAAEGHIALTQDLEITLEHTINLQNCEIELNGHALTLTAPSESADAFSVRGLVTITDSAGGGSITCRNGGSVFSLTRTGTVQQQGGTVQCINDRPGMSGHYVVQSSGRYDLSGGCIDGREQYGGIYGTAGEIRMTDGEIKNGCSMAYGGGVRTDAGCTFTMSGGTIHDNRVTDAGTALADVGRGGGISAKGMAYILGGTIRENRATYGGGLHLANDTLIQRALIEENISDHVGAGIFCDHYSRVVIQAPEGEKQAVKINNNRSLDVWGYGAGGIFVEHSNSATEIASLYLMDACITGNKVLAGTPEGSPYAQPLTSKMGGGVATCGVSNLEVVRENACVIFDNALEGETVFSDSQDIWCQSKASVSGVVLGGVEVKYTGRRKDDIINGNYSPLRYYDTNTVPVASKLGQTVTGQWMSLTTDSASLSEADKRFLRSTCGVLIEGNTTYTKGGGVAGNGYIRFGSTPPDIPEPKDPPAREKVPEITTLAGADPAASGKSIEAAEDAVIYDIVLYKNVKAGEDYELHSTVYETGSHAGVVGADEAVITPFTPSETSGSVTTEIHCNTTWFAQKTLVVVQELYKDGQLVAEHFDFQDAAQQVSVARLSVDITTNAKIMGERNGQDTEYLGNTDLDTLPIQETVNMNPLLPGRVYRIVCSILDKPTGEPVFSRESSFEAETSAMRTTLPNLYLPLKELTGSAAVLGVELYDGDEQVGSHMDVMDLSETVRITDIPSAEAGTQAQLEQGSGQDALRKWTLTDGISIDDEGRWIEGGYLLTQIADAESGEILWETEQQVNDDYGGWEDLKSVITQDTEGTIVGESLLALRGGRGTFPAEAFAGRSLVVYETLQYYEDEVKHADPQDAAQTFVFTGPAMTSQADVNGLQTAEAALGTVITDTVKVADWFEADGTLPAGAVLRGYVVDALTGHIEAQNDVKVGGTAVSGSSFTLQNTFNVDTRKMINEDLVIMEQLIIDGEVVCSHENMHDELQTIRISPLTPEIITHAAAEDGSKTVLNTVTSTVKDSVSLSKLQPGREYTLKGVLADRKTGREIEGSEAEITFTAEAASMEVENSFLYMGGADAGSSIVVFERLYQGGRLVAEHTNLDDPEQTLALQGGTFKTKASGPDGRQELAVSSRTTVTDYISGGTQKFEPDTYITVRSWLADKETGERVSISGEPWVQEKTVYIADDGVLETSVDLTFSSFGLAGTSCVVFEELYSAAGKLIASHTDLDDEDQTVSFIAAPVIMTNAAGTDGEKAVDAGITKVVDTISFGGFTPGQTYTVQSEIVCLQDGEVLDSRKSFFLAEAAEGETAVELKVSAGLHAGHTLVCYEEVFDEHDNLIASHVDASDPRQQVAVNPKFQTYAAGEDGAKNLPPSENTVITDRIEYDGLTIGRTYTLEGRLIVADTGRVLQTKRETLRADASDGTYQMTFEADTTRLKGRRLVVTYRLLLGNTVAALHSDLDNIEQSIYIEDAGKLHIMTSAALADGSKSVQLASATTVHFTDEIYYSGLQVGHVYGIFSHLFDKATGEEYAPSGDTLNMMNRGDESRFMIFEPAEANGVISVPMHFRVKTPQNMDLVVGQQIYDLGYARPMTPWWSEEAGEVIGIYSLVMEHMDLSDLSETISLKTLNVETRALQTEAMPEAPDVRTPWQKLKDAVRAGETYTLTADIEGTADAGAQNVILAELPGAVIDLNGYTLTIANNSGAPSVRVTEGASLLIENGTVNSGHSGTFAENSGTLRMDAVSVTASRVSTSLLTNHGTAEIADCTLDGAQKVNNCIINTPAGNAQAPDLTLSGSTVITGGKVRSSSSPSGAGIHSTGAASKVTLRGSAMVRDCESPADGGGIRMAGGTLSLQDMARLLSCTSSGSGGGIFADQGAELEIGGNAAVSLCEAKQSGGGVYAGAGTSVRLTQQAAVSDCDSASGGGIYALSGTDVTMNGSAGIRNCTVSQHGGGICSTGSVTVSGAAVITQCTAARAGGGIYSPDAAAAITISENAQITDCNADGTNAEHGGGAIFAKGTTTLSGSALIARCETGWLGGGIASYGTLTVTDEAGIEDCRANGGSYGGGGIVNYGAAALGGNARITGCSAVRSGGAFYNYGAGSTLNADGSVTISGGTANFCGGIYNYQGTATVTGTVIRDCTSLAADIGGGGFYNNAGRATLNGSTKIAGCSAPGLGGGIYQQGTSSVLTLDDDAAVTDCTTKKDGGGIYIKEGTCFLRGNAEVNGCTAAESGGGLYPASGARIFMEGSSAVRRCTATSLGGGMFINGGSASLSESAVFEDCSAAGFGGGAMWVNNSGSFAMSESAAIRGCSAANGGGIYNANNCTVVMQDNALITGCSATTAGGAVFNTGVGSKFTVKSVAKITGNTCSVSGKGAGIHCANGTVTVYSTDAIAGNTPTNSYGTITTNAAL